MSQFSSSPSNAAPAQAQAPAPVAYPYPPQPAQQPQPAAAPVAYPYTYTAPPAYGAAITCPPVPTAQPPTYCTQYGAIPVAYPPPPPPQTYITISNTSANVPLLVREEEINPIPMLLWVSGWCTGLMWLLGSFYMCSSSRYSRRWGRRNFACFLGLVLLTLAFWVAINNVSAD
eukprot:m51a1_g1269 hypothetical protein (173) ;mRNA; f:94981-95693